LAASSCSGPAKPEERAPEAAATAESEKEKASNAELDASPTNEAFNRYLLASVPDRRIYLFAEENGVSLYAGDNVREFEWGYMTPRGIEPVLDVRDFDGDGTDELAVILYIGSGTGVSVDELRIVELGELRDFVFSDEDYLPQIEQAIAKLKADSALPSRYADEKISFGQQVDYEVGESGIKARFMIGTIEKTFPVTEYFGDVIADVTFSDGKFVLTHFRFEEHEPPADAELTSAEPSAFVEPDVNNESAESPDGKYLAEAYGVNKGITAGGLYPAEGIRLKKKASDKELWSMMGFYSHSFLWSSNSRYVAVSYMARIWGGTLIVDARDGSEIELPDLEAVRKQWKGKTTVHDARPDTMFWGEEWLDTHRLRVSFQWTGADYETYSGEFVYDVAKRKLSDLKQNDVDRPL